MKTFILLLAFALSLPLSLLTLSGQERSSDSTYRAISGMKNSEKKVEELLGLSSSLLGTDIDQAMDISTEALDLAEDIHYAGGAALAHKNIGIVYYVRGNYAEALQSWRQAQDIYNSIDDQSGVSNMLSNRGAIYFNQGDHSNAIDLYLQSLKIAEEIGDKKRVATVHQNIGAVYSESENSIDEALESYLKALPVFEALNDKNGTGLTSLNIGELYTKLNNLEEAYNYYSRALDDLQETTYHSAALRAAGSILTKRGKTQEGIEYLNKSLEEAITNDDAFEIAKSLNSLALANQNLSNIDAAIELYKKAISTALKTSNSNTPLKEAYEGMVEVYAGRDDYKTAFQYKNLLENVKDSIFNAASEKRMGSLRFNAELEKKESTIALLLKDTELQKAEVKRQKIMRNGFMIGFAGMLLLTGIILSQQRNIKRNKKRSDELLLNILPKEVAEELKTKGSTEAKHFDNISVVFTDFIEFTQSSEQLSAQELVKVLNTFFEEFDNITAKYEIEKIKTIGDSYMAAGGIGASGSSVKNTVCAALEMQDYIIQKNQVRKSKGEVSFDMRVGIHTGPVVAGVVGKKKFQYDIWGDTVNTASRMESSGAVQKVNISEKTYELLKREPDLEFENRGEIDVKGKGKMGMYFVTSTSSKP